MQTSTMKAMIVLVVTVLIFGVNVRADLDPESKGHFQEVMNYHRAVHLFYQNWIDNSYNSSSFTNKQKSYYDNLLADDTKELLEMSPELQLFGLINDPDGGVEDEPILNRILALFEEFHGDLAKYLEEKFSHVGSRQKRELTRWQLLQQRREDRQKIKAQGQAAWRDFLKQQRLNRIERGVYRGPADKLARRLKYLRKREARRDKETPDNAPPPGEGPAPPPGSPPVAAPPPAPGPGPSPPIPPFPNNPPDEGIPVNPGGDEGLFNPPPPVPAPPQPAQPPQAPGQPPAPAPAPGQAPAPAPGPPSPPGAPPSPPFPNNPPNEFIPPPEGGDEQLFNPPPPPPGPPPSPPFPNGPPKDFIPLPEGGEEGMFNTGRRKRSVEQPERRNYMSLTEDERSHFIASLKWLMTSQIDGVSRYDLFVMKHRLVEAPNAYSDSNGLIWNKKYIQRFENAINQYDTQLESLPYMDMCELIDSPDVAMKLLNDLPTNVISECKWIGATLKRSFIFSNITIEKSRKLLGCHGEAPSSVWSMDEFATLHSLFGPCVEGGSHLACPSCAVTDPLFWLIYSGLDLKRSLYM